MAQKIARIAHIAVAVVLNPAQLMLACISFQLAALHIQQGAQQRGRSRAGFQQRHRTGTAHPGAAQQLQQQRFGLVILLMCGEQKVRIERGKDALALVPRGRFDSGRVVARDRYPMNAQFNSMRCA